MSDSTIAGDFKMVRDFRNIDWLSTLWYNLLRALGAALVWGLVLMVAGQHGIGGYFLMLVIWPIGWLIAGLPIGFITAKLSGVIPFIGLISVMMSLFFVAVGDPLVALLNRFVPQAVPVDDAPFFQMNIITFVLKPQVGLESAFTNY